MTYYLHYNYSRNYANHILLMMMVYLTRRADILVAALGKPKFITADYVKKGAVVIDVGIHRNAENKLCGDVDFASVEPVASAITPVPGGVGPMTIAMLMVNCLKSAQREEGVR